jgi:hypothetical protein
MANDVNISLYRNADRGDILWGAYPNGNAPIPDISNELTLDDFEYTTIPKVPFNSMSSDLWNHYGNDPNFEPGYPDVGSVETTTTESYSGSRSLQVNVDNGNIYTQFYPNDSAEWFYMREINNAINTPQWELDTYEALRVWIKVPPLLDRTDGRGNFTVGTYFRGTEGSRNSSEGDGGGHGYHYYNLRGPDVWHQIIIDRHMSHLRGSTGSAEQPVLTYPTGEAGYNYFDLMTRFYFDGNGIPDSGSSYPYEYYIDKVELFKERAGYNVTSVYNPSAAFKPSTNTLYLAWNRIKPENSVDHEVRYSFSPIGSWGDTTAAPSGIVSPPGVGGYNIMLYETSSINVGSNTVMYIAIKPQNSDDFRVLEVPLVGVE